MARIRTIDRWEDPRLTVTGGETGALIKVTDDIWKPAGKFKHLIDSHALWEETYIIGEGHIVRIREETAEIGCGFDFTWFPWDWQR